MPSTSAVSACIGIRVIIIFFAAPKFACLSSYLSLILHSETSFSFVITNNGWSIPSHKEAAETIKESCSPASDGFTGTEGQAGGEVTAAREREEPAWEASHTTESGEWPA